MFDSIQKSSGMIESQISEKKATANEFFNQIPVSGVRDSVTSKGNEEVGLSMFGSIKSDKSQNQSMEFQPKESMKSVPPKEEIGFSMFQSKNSEQNSVKSGKSIKKEEA